MVPATASTAQGSGRAGADLDLVVTTTPVTLAPGTQGVQTVTVTNRGEAAEGEVLVTYVTSAYTNLANTPRGCTIRYENLDPTVPEVLTCLIDPSLLGANQSTTVDVPLDLTTRARLTGLIPAWTSAVPAPGSADTETNPSTSWKPSLVSVTGPTPATPDGNRVGLYLSHVPAILDKQNKGTAGLIYGNIGPNPLRGEVQLTAVSPFFTKFDQAQLPEGCTLELTDASPGIPDIVVCRRPGLEVDEEARLDLPLMALDGHPDGSLVNNALVAPASPDDVENDQTDNTNPLFVVAPARSD
jgi:hypothetical protein